MSIKPPRSASEAFFTVGQMQGRFGKSPSEWLAWIIRFMQMDLTLLHPGEREALGVDLQLLPIVVQSPDKFDFWNMSRKPMADSVMEQIQADLISGFRSLENSWGGSWDVPGPKVVRIRRNEKSKSGFTSVWHTDGDERDFVLAVVGRLLLDHGEKVRWCPTCSKIFVAQGRQTFCSLQCGNRVRVAKCRAKQGKDDKVKAKVLEQRRANYAKKVKEKLGGKVRVGKRA